MQLSPEGARGEGGGRVIRMASNVNRMGRAAVSHVIWHEAMRHPLQGASRIMYSTTSTLRTCSDVDSSGSSSRNADITLLPAVAALAGLLTVPPSRRSRARRFWNHVCT